jgi:hypothetical protein
MINVGTIMELYKSEVLVMTIDFNLVYVRRVPEMYLGQQVTFVKSQVVRPQNKRLLFVVSGIAAVLIFAIIAINILQIKGLNREDNFYAFIDMDVNPSIEFLIDDKNVVQKVLPLNSDAEKMTKYLPLRKMPIKKAIGKVIDWTYEMGIIDSNKNDVIMISASLNSENSDYNLKRDNVEHRLDKLLDSLKDINGAELNRKYNIKTVKGEPAIKKQAIKNGLSTGRQLILEKAHTQGIDLTLNEVKSGNLSMLMKKVGMDVKNNDKQHISSPTVTPAEKATASGKPTSKKEIQSFTDIPGKEAVSYSPIPEKAKVTPTSKKETATSESISKPTPVPITESIRPSETKTPDSSPGSIKIQYYNSSKGPGDIIQISGFFNIVNTGNTIIDLKDVTIRYYYTIDGEKPQYLDCWANVDKPNITYRFVKMNKPVKKADYYLEIGFKNGQLEPGTGTKVVVWFNKEGWPIYKQDDDYSYNSPKIQELYDWEYVTGYITGVLKWGIEPVQ